MEEYKIDDIDSLTLNCSISPSLKNIEMNQLSDEIMFICNNIIFDDFDHDFYKKVLTNGILTDDQFKDLETLNGSDFVKNTQYEDDVNESTRKKLKLSKTDITNLLPKIMEAHLFPSAISDVSSYNMVLKMTDFKVTVDNLIEKLEFINTKKTRLEGPKMMINSIIFIYIAVVVVLFITYISFKYGGEENAGKADNYNIGFVSTSAYIYLFSQLKDHYFEYSELQGQMGHYDENICASLANIIKNIKSIYKYLLNIKKTTDTNACKTNIKNQAVALYKLIYTDEVFKQARAHFKTTVNYINSFIDKQKKYLLKVHNTNMDVKNNNEYMEDFYNILLKGHGIKLLKVEENETPFQKRNTLINQTNNSTTNNSTTSNSTTNNSTTNNSTTSNSTTNNSTTSNSTTTNNSTTSNSTTTNNSTTTSTTNNWDKYIIDNFIKKVIEMNKIKTKSQKFELDETDKKEFMLYLTDILFFLKTIKNNGLPEYDQIKKLIFPVNMEDHTNFTIDSFIEFINPSLKATSTSIQATDSVLRYFETTVLNYYKENGLFGETTVATDNSFLAKITKRNSNVSSIKVEYSEFAKALKKRILVDDDLTDEGSFGRVFEKIKNDFIENTQNYKLNENIVMRFMTFMFKNDEQFHNDKSSTIILSNIRFIVGVIMKKVAQSQTIRNDLMDSKKINTAKYISFMNFESKMSELNANDLNNFLEYIKNTKDTIKSFRRYTKTEEILFSKKEQISHVYSKLHRDIFIVFGIILAVFIYEEYFKEKFAKADMEGIRTVGKAAFNVGKKVGTNARAAARATASGVYNSTGRLKNYVKGKVGDAATSAYAEVTNIPTRFETGLDDIKTMGKNWTTAALRQSNAIREKSRKYAEEATTNRKKVKQDGGEDNVNESVSKVEPVKQPVKEESQSEKDVKETEKALSFNKYINMSLIIVVYGIFMTFTKSYLMKHEADLQYDKVINVINTTKFETEFYRLTEAFEEYKTNRSTENCKKVYNSLIQVLEMYDKCNFIKSSIKSTPFPVAEMWTNGIVLVIFLAVLYITFVQTDVESYWENQNKLDELLNSLDDISSGDNEEELVKNIEKELSKEKDELAKAINNFDWHKSKKYIRDIYGINKELKDEMEKVFKATTQKTGDKKISNEEKKEAYQKLIDKLETDMEKAQDDKEAKDELKKAIENNDWYSAEKYIGDIYGINKEVKDEMRKVFDDNAQKTDKEKKEAYQKLIDKLEKDMDKAQDEKEQKGGMVTGYPMGMGMTDPSMLTPTNNKAQMQKKLLEQYTKQTNAVQSQIIKMKRDTKYVNLSMSIMILMFGSYFCVSILNNTRNYQNMLVSGGTVFRDCL